MNLNELASGTRPFDMTSSDEFASLLTSANDLGIAHSPSVAYRSRHTVVRGQRLHFSEWGDPDAPALVFLHGSNQSSHSWDLVSLHFADRFRVFAVDQRGHGDSEWSRDLDYRSDTMALDAAAFIEELEIDDPIVFGHSMGGRVTLKLARNAPALVKALVIVDSGPEMSPIGGRMIRNFIQANREFDSLDEFLDNVTRYDPYRSREHIARTAKYNLIQRADGKLISKTDRRRVEVEDSPLSLSDVESIELPTLVVRGRDSNVLEAAAAERFAAALANGKWVEVPDCGHNVHSQNTIGFIDAVTPFLNDHS